MTSQGFNIPHDRSLTGQQALTLIIKNMKKETKKQREQRLAKEREEAARKNRNGVFGSIF